jgi:hypothetical protein
MEAEVVGRHGLGTPSALPCWGIKVPALNITAKASLLRSEQGSPTQ